MPQSLSRVIIHLVYSTKHREPLITPNIDAEMHRYHAGTLTGLGCLPIRVGGADDHIHLLFALGRTITIAKTVEKLKTGSSVLIKERNPRFDAFHWQGGYGAFSVAETDIARVAAYIDRQREHHQTISFQEEYLALLKEYGIAYDERYVWD